MNDPWCVAAWVGLAFISGLIVGKCRSGKKHYEAETNLFAETHGARGDPPR